MSLEGVLLIIAAYFIGSVPTAYLVGKLLKGVDVRKYGSRNVGGANVWQTVSRWIAIPVILVDVIKGLVAVFIAQQIAGLDLVEQVVVGLAAIIGHNWSVFLRFSGGRGMATSLGVLILLAPWGLLVSCAAALVGLFLKNLPLGVGIGMAVLPLVSWSFGEELPVVFGCLGIFLLMVARRLTANWEPGAFAGDWKRVVVCRLLFDRDIWEREAWVRRSSSESPETYESASLEEPRSRAKNKGKG